MTLTLLLQMIWMAGISYPQRDERHIKLVAREAVKWYVMNYKDMKQLT